MSSDYDKLSHERYALFQERKLRVRDTDKDEYRNKLVSINSLRVVKYQRASYSMTLTATFQLRKMKSQVHLQPLYRASIL